VTFRPSRLRTSDAVPGGPDAADYAGDLARWIDHLKFSDVRLVAQSMGGWNHAGIRIAHPAKVKRWVLSSTSGRSTAAAAILGRGQYDAWPQGRGSENRGGRGHASIPRWRPGSGTIACLAPSLCSIDDMRHSRQGKGACRPATRCPAQPGGPQDFRVPTLLIAAARTWSSALLQAVAQPACGEAN